MALTGLKLAAAKRRQLKQDAALVAEYEFKANGTEIAYEHKYTLSDIRNDEYIARNHNAALDRKALAAARKAAEPKRDKTCQICARGILANTGLIAHHGYTRPDGWHYQTASCPGARYEPYEVSCDRLKVIIAQVERTLEAAKQGVVNLKTPPAQVFYAKRTGKWIGKRQETVNIPVEKPADFVDDGRDDYMPESYRHILAGYRYQAEQHVRRTTEHLKWLTDRLAAWKAPTK